MTTPTVVVVPGDAHGAASLIGTPSPRLTAARIGNDPSVEAALIVSVFVGLGSVIVYIAMLLWAAREDGRDQRRRDRQLGHR